MLQRDISVSLHSVVPKVLKQCNFAIHNFFLVPKCALGKDPLYILHGVLANRRSKNTTNNIQHKTQHMSRHCLDIDWDIRHWNIFLNIFWIYLKKDEKKEEKSGSAGDRTHGGGRVPLCCLTLYRLRHRTYTFESSKNKRYKRNIGSSKGKNMLVIYSIGSKKFEQAFY